MQITFTIVFIGALVFLAHLFAGIFSRTRVSDALLLILIGLALGPFSGLVTPQSFGAVGPVFTTVTLIVILFESGIGLRIDSLRNSVQGTMALTTVNFIATMTTAGAFVWIFTSLGGREALILGAILGGTAPAVVIPLVRQLKMEDGSRTILVLESAVGEVLTIVVALAFLRTGESHIGMMAGQLISSFGLAMLFGALGAFGWSILLNKVRTIQNSIFTTPTFVFIVFGVVELLGYSGAIAALAFGVTRGNIQMLKIPILTRHLSNEPIALSETEKVFFSEAVFLLKTFFFVYIGLSIPLTDPWWVSFGLLLTVGIFALRVLVVRFSVAKSTPVQDASLMAVIVPKGLAAAVLASLPLQGGLQEGR